MGERQQPAEEMATTSTAITTVVPAQVEESERVVVTLRPAPATASEPRKKVVWTEDTVDNEHMNKKKSKCCCIYEKPRRFDESDSEESDDECEHCFGHVERRRGVRQHHHAGPVTQQQETAPSEEAVAITLQEEPDRPAQAEPSPHRPDQPPDRDVTG